MVSAFSGDAKAAPTPESEDAQESGGSGFSNEQLMRAVLDHDQAMLEQGELVAESLSHNISGFTVDLFFEQLTKKYALAKQLYGDRLIRLVTGYMPQYIERNLHIPEFQKELKTQIARRMDEMHGKEVLDDHGRITEKGLELAALVLYAQEIDMVTPKGFTGERQAKRESRYGDRKETRQFRKGDRYKDISVRQSLRQAIRRGNSSLTAETLRVAPRESKGMLQIIYGIDASASMRGKKIETAKKAGVALAFKAVERKDRVGIVVFGTDIKEAIEPTDEFGRLLRALVRVRASMQTDFTKMITKSIELFQPGASTKHLLILTDALPTVGEAPEKETLQAVSAARAVGITISVVGIDLDSAGVDLARQIVSIGEGRLYVVHSLADVDRIVLEDYYAESGSHS